MTRILTPLAIVLSLFLAGCYLYPPVPDPPPRTYVVLLEEDDGSVGEVTVSTDAGERTLHEKGYGVKMSGSHAAPGEAFAVPKTRFDQLFHEAIVALPKPSAHFSLYFDTGKSEVTKASLPDVDTILGAVAEREFPRLSIVGHSDRAGNKESNFRLALKRAESVRKLLQDRGVKPAFIIDVTSHGENDPVVDTPDGVAEPLNRRVEVIVR